MRVLLLWSRHSEPKRDVRRVSAKLQKLFAPLFSSRPWPTIMRSEACDLVLLQLPVEGWKPSFLQADERTWCLALEYPVNARTVLDSSGIGGDAVLPGLCRALEQNPRSCLRELAPPFSLVWSAKATGELLVQNDALGQAQLFEFRDSRTWALTNKVLALQALDLPLEPEPEEWAVRAALGWFPLQTTGFKKVRFVEPATQFRVRTSGVRRRSFEVLSEWLHPQNLSREDCLELARCSLLEQIDAARKFWVRPSVGLSGGLDSRAVVSCLRAAGVDFAARVRGRPDRDDVLIASELARIAGFELRVKPSGGLPGEHVRALRRSIALALRWQAGAMVTRKHATFLVRKLLDGGTVNVMGQHGEIGRSTYAADIRAAEVPERQYEDRFVSALMERAPPFTRPELRDRIHEVVRTAYRQADRYDLSDLDRLDFFYLYERTRRGNSGSLNAQTGVVVAPFLNPNYIRAGFGYGASKEGDPFHRHIIAVNTPDWIDVPVVARRPWATCQTQSPRLDGRSSAWKQPAGNQDYHAVRYWQQVGQPLIDEALAKGGFWTEIFDPVRAAAQWDASPDALAILHLLPEALHGGADQPRG